MRRFVSLVVGTALTACGGDGGSGPSAHIANIFVSAPQASIAVGEKTQLTAVAIDSVGNTVNTTFQWSSSAPVVASVSNSGLLTGVSTGSATVSASAGGKTGTLTMTVRATAGLAVVTMPPGDVFAPFQVTIPAGGTVRWEFPQRAHNVIFEKKTGVPADIQQTTNAAVSRTFAVAGTFPYDCTLHPGMAGEVIVH